MFGENNLGSDIPNGVSYEAVFGKKRNFKYMVGLGLLWESTEGVLLRGDDTKESSSEPAAGTENPEAWDTGSDSTYVPPMCSPLPSGKIMNLPDEVESVVTGDTRHQVEILLDQNDDNLFAEASYAGDSLATAVEMADAKAVERILNLSSTVVNTVDGNGKTALHIASEQGFEEIVKKILSRPDTDVNKFYGEDPAVTLAGMGNHVEVVKLLATDPRIDVVDLNFCFLNSVGWYNHEQVVSYLLTHPAIDVNFDESGTTPLCLACQGGNLKIVEQLLQRDDLELNKVDDTDQTPLFMACAAGHLAIVEKLLEKKGIKVNKAENHGATPLYMACQEGNLEIVDQLLDRNDIEVNKALHQSGETPLIQACDEGHVEIVKKLLARKDVELNRTYKGSHNTAFTAACLHGHLDVVQTLLEHPGTDITTHLKKALSNASDGGHDDIVNLLQNVQIQD